MLTITAQVTSARRGGVPITGAGPLALGERLRAFVEGERRASAAAARRATAVSRQQFTSQLSGRPPAPPRRGRPTTRGKFAQHVVWEPTATGVEFDINKMQTAAPYWLIQEVGTGQRAVMKRGGAKNPRGRPTKGAAHSVSIPSQIGRPLPLRYLGWADRPGGRYTPPSRRRDQQLQVLRRLKGERPMFASEQHATIGREIRAKRFVAKGAEEGFRQYKEDVLAVARRTLVKRYRP